MNDTAPFDYLSLMGIQTYRPRRPLPGAAPSPVAVETQTVAMPPSTADTPDPAPARRQPPSLPDLDAAARKPGKRREAAAPPRPKGDEAPRFNLMAIAAGPWLWLEELAGERPTAEQVKLVEAMSDALARAGGPEDVSQGGGPRTHRVTFRWPLHGNDQQFDQGPAAAAAALRAFVMRQVEERCCQGVVLLGEDCAARFSPAGLGVIPVVTTAGTAEMIARPAIKRRVWQDLQALIALQ